MRVLHPRNRFSSKRGGNYAKVFFAGNVLLLPDVRSWECGRAPPLRRSAAGARRCCIDRFARRDAPR